MKSVVILLLLLLECVKSYLNHNFINNNKLKNSISLSSTSTTSLFAIQNVMVNGMPGLMALETAIACIDRGYNILPIGFTGPDSPNSIIVKGKTRSQEVKLIKGPGISNPEDIDIILKNIKKDYPNMVTIDFTHPSAIYNNLETYVKYNCDFVMGTTGGDQSKQKEIFDRGNIYAVIAPNMAKQIVAVQAALLAMAQRFPKSFEGYKLEVTESHQKTKADTSGTAKAIVSHLATLNGKDFNIDQINMLRDEKSQLAFNVPKDYIDGHAFHTYTLTSSDGTVQFQLQHNVCGRRVYAEGTADAVEFVSKVREQKQSKKLYNMIDVLEAGAMG